MAKKIKAVRVQAPGARRSRVTLDPQQVGLARKQKRFFRRVFWFGFVIPGMLGGALLLGILAGNKGEFAGIHFGAPDTTASQSQHESKHESKNESSDKSSADASSSPQASTAEADCDGVAKKAEAKPGLRRVVVKIACKRARDPKRYYSDCRPLIDELNTALAGVQLDQEVQKELVAEGVDVASVSVGGDPNAYTNAIPGPCARSGRFQHLDAVA